MATIVWSPSLTMDAALAAQIIAAMRAQYPEVVTADLTDAQAARVWVKYMVSELLARQAERSAVADPGSAAAAAANAVWQQVRQAGIDARTNATTGITTP